MFVLPREMSNEMYSALQFGAMSNVEASTDMFSVKHETDTHVCSPDYGPETASSQSDFSPDDFGFLSDANIGEFVEHLI